MFLLGDVRKDMIKIGKAKKIYIRRSMTSTEVDIVINNAFSRAGRTRPYFLKASQDNSLRLHRKQSLNGQEVVNLSSSSGSLYLCETEVISYTCNCT